MSHSVALPVSGPVAGAALPVIPLRELAPWALFFGLLSMLVIFFVTQGAITLSEASGTAIHEWVHDARHLLGYPCH